MASPGIKEWRPGRRRPNGAVLLYYQPQIDEWKDYKELTGRMAFSLTPSGGKAVLGVADVQAATLVDKDSHTVFLPRHQHRLPEPCRRYSSVPFQQS